MKIVVILLMLIIAASLLSAGFFLVKDHSGSDRTVKALTVRITLSVVLFALLMLGHYFGFIQGRLN